MKKKKVFSILFAVTVIGTAVTLFYMAKQINPQLLLYIYGIGGDIVIMTSIYFTRVHQLQKKMTEMKKGFIFYELSTREQTLDSISGLHKDFLKIASDNEMGEFNNNAIAGLAKRYVETKDLGVFCTSLVSDHKIAVQIPDLFHIYAEVAKDDSIKNKYEGFLKGEIQAILMMPDDTERSKKALALVKFLEGPLEIFKPRSFNNRKKFTRLDEVIVLAEKLGEMI